MSVQIVQIPVSTGYKPRPFQQFIHQNAARFTVDVAHRRAGKTVKAVNHIIHHAINCKLELPRYAYIAPFYGQAKNVAWDYFKKYTAGLYDHVANVRLVKYYESDPVQLELLTNNAKIFVIGADRPDAIRGQYFDGVVLDEYSQMRPRVFSEIIRPALSDRKGWALFIGTPKGKNGFFDLYDQAKNGFKIEDGTRVIDPEWRAFMFKASETGLISPEELASAKRDMSPEEYEQEYECSFQAAVVGSFYGAQIAELERQGRLINADIYEPKLPVQTAWDLGMDDSTSIWFFQVYGKEVRIIDYYENSGHGLEHYVKVLNDRGYEYSVDWLPHDAEVRELGTGRTRVETLTRMGRKPRLIPRMEVMDGINSARLTLPHCWFNSLKCSDGIEALRMYRREYDEKAKDFKTRPYHDWTSHAADAFRYLASAWQAQRPKPVEEKRPEGITLNDLLKAKENRPDNYRIN